MRVWALAALLVAAWMADRAYAHGGGGFRGPSGGIPPGLREPQDPQPPPPPPPGVGWKSWRGWWMENREPVLQRKARLLADPSIEFGPGAPPSPIRVRRLERARDRAILPVLHRLWIAPETPAEVKLALLRSMGRCGGSEEAALLIETVMTAEPGSPPEVLHTALAALGRLRVERSRRLLQCAWTVLRNPMGTAKVRAAAALVLGLHGDARVSKELVEFLRKDCPPRDVMKAVVFAVGLIGDDGARETLEALARGVPLGREVLWFPLKACAVRSLGLIGSDRSIRSLLGLLPATGGSDQVSAAAALALGEFPHARQVALVLQELALDHSNRPQVAQCATLALGRFEHPEVVPTLISVLENGDWQAFDFAALALAGRVARDFRRDSVRPAEVSRIRTALREATKLNQYTKGIVLALARDPGIGRDISKLSRRRFGSRLHQFQSEVAEILGERRPEIMQILEDQFRTIPGTDLTVASVRAFASLGAIDFNKRLRDPFLESYDYDSIRAPLDAAGYTADPIAVPFLIDVLLDSKRSCGQRTAAADALGRIGDVRLMDPFVRLRLRSPFPVGFLGFDEPAWN